MLKSYSRGLLAALALAYTLPAAAGNLTFAKSLTVSDAPWGNVARSFKVYQPTGWQDATAMPVVILLHGGTLSYDTPLSSVNAAYEWRQIADTEPGRVLILVPNGAQITADTIWDADNLPQFNTTGSNQHWNDCRSDTNFGPGAEDVDDVGFIAALIDWVEASEYNIDPDRIYVVGSSNGGMMSYRLARELNDRIAGIAAFIAAEPSDNTNSCGAPTQSMPVFIANGTADQVIPWAGSNAPCPDVGCLKSGTATRTVWTTTNGLASVTPVTVNYTDVFANDGPSTVSSQRWAANGREVMFYTVSGGGHLEPSVDHPYGLLTPASLKPQNRDIEGAREAWAFLKRFSLPHD